jgi:hypothetical protein
MTDQQRQQLRDSLARTRYALAWTVDWWTGKKCNSDVRYGNAQAHLAAHAITNGCEVRLNQ